MCCLLLWHSSHSECYFLEMQEVSTSLRSEAGIQHWVISSLRALLPANSPIGHQGLGPSRLLCSVFDSVGILVCLKICRSVVKIKLSPGMCSQQWMCSVAYYLLLIHNYSLWIHLYIWGYEVLGIGLHVCFGRDWKWSLLQRTFQTCQEKSGKCPGSHIVRSTAEQVPCLGCRSA